MPLCVLASRTIVPSYPHFSEIHSLSSFQALKLSPLLNCRTLTAWTSTLPPPTTALLSYSWQLLAVPMRSALHGSDKAFFSQFPAALLEAVRLDRSCMKLSPMPFLSISGGLDLQLHTFLTESVRSGNFLLVLPAVGKRSCSSLLTTSFQLAACCACFASPQSYAGRGLRKWAVKVIFDVSA